MTAITDELDEAVLLSVLSDVEHGDFTPVVPDVLRAKVSVFVDLFLHSEQLHLKSQELESSLQSITTLNAALRDGEASTQAVLDNVATGFCRRRVGTDRIRQPLCTSSVRIPRGRGDRTAPEHGDRADTPR